MCNQYQEAVKQRRVEIESRILKLQDKIKNAFADYCQLPYYLHAIMIHDGCAESGHYYSFIFDTAN